MQIGSFNIPEVRLNPTILDDIKKVYDAIGEEEITSNDLAKTLGYSANTSGNFYRKLASLQTFGLLEGRGSFRVTTLGKNLSYPEDDFQKSKALKEAVLSVDLWKIFFDKFGKKPPSNNFWVQIKNTTGLDSPKAQKMEETIRRWYLDDVSSISDSELNTQELNIPDTTDNYRNPVMYSQFSSQEPVEGKGQLIIPHMGNLEINDYTLAIARQYLDVFENKLKEEKKQSHPKMICAPCSKDEENNPTGTDVVMSQIITDFDEGDEYKSWQCPKCQYKVWTFVSEENK